MSAGTLTLTNNSDLVSGAGTSFSTELTAGDFVVATVGGVTYTLPVKSVEGDTEITLISKYPGPTQQGSAWNAVPRATQNQITAALVVQSTEALRGLNYDKQNWQAVFSVDGHITVMLPDGSSFTGPSWLSIANILNTLDVEYLDQLAAQIKQDAQQVEADKNTVVDTAQQVSTDAQTASTAATGAQGSATEAAQSETNAEGYKELARKYALNPEDDPVTDNEYSALHYSEKAKKSAAEAASHNPAEALVKSLNLSDLADRAAAWLNVRPIGSTPLAGDPVNPYDATTQRWVENYVSGGGGTGPTMNGVQNFGVGMPILWTSRAFTPAWAVVSDGQSLNRADWPELWVHAQMHTPIDDADWLANPGKRGNYSNGDGSTTFRVPDFNGVQSGSIPGLFGRGDQGGALPSGGVYESAAPNITGILDVRPLDYQGGNYPEFVGSTGAFSRAGLVTAVQQAVNAASTRTGITVSDRAVFRASDSNPVYGRSTNQVWPNSFVGVWIIRASGGFTAANTSWSVINEDAEAPGPGVLTRGGNVISSYKIAGVEVARGSLSVSHNTYSSGFRDVSAVIEAWSTDASASWSFNHAGFIKPNTPSGQFITQAEIGLSGGLFANGDRFIAVGLRDQNTANADAVGKTWIMSLNGTSGLQFIARNRAQSNVGQLVINMPYSSGTLALQGTSGLAYKRDIKDADLAEAVNRIDALRMVNYVYKDDEQNRERFGIIAEEAELVAPQYIKHNSEEIADIMDDDGNKIGAETRDRPSVDNNPIVMDLLGYVKHLKAEIEMLKTALKG
ncbi:tail fiber domain-containing protein [Citrobacter amalonaticus]|nr:tail fiber domain-containing protein [Citrobacter amalonaticus]EKW3840960.1 tail fiber domain-containing protein [Citrobacter amalonaticus]MDV0783528.1 tail fiber domain-containing protein [Citrobacter amalonaticus]MEB0639591.1 tail fiber domain-containing protein [Citrobacter amalonaticus]HCD1275166.1 tail fiber domain-containing protein [Citrobacter amalonaticus]